MAREAKSLIAFLVTGSLLALAVILAWLLYTEYYSNPWTRDAHVRANVIEIAPRVAGPIVSLAVSDNALVQRGQLLFEIDPSDYHNALAIAQSVFDQRQAELVNAQAAFDRSQRLLGTKVISKGENDAATATFESAKALYEGSFAALRQAKLNLEYTKVYAPATGYVSGVTFGLGTYVQTGKPVFVLIDRESYWVTALFKETVLPSLTPGRPVSIRFAPRPGQEFHGTIESLGWGISDNDAGYSMSLPSIAPTVDWVRLTQRYPVRIRLGADALKLPLKIGVTASVRVLGVPGQLNP
jgi:RND family efflux transporter, MFP subunit